MHTIILQQDGKMYYTTAGKSSAAFGLLSASPSDPSSSSATTARWLTEKMLQADRWTQIPSTDGCGTANCWNCGCEAFARYTESTNTCRFALVKSTDCQYVPFQCLIKTNTSPKTCKSQSKPVSIELESYWKAKDKGCARVKVGSIGFRGDCYNPARLVDLQWKFQNTSSSIDYGR